MAPLRQRSRQNAGYGRLSTPAFTCNRDFHPDTLLWRLIKIEDTTGFCGHSDETIDLIRRNFSVFVAGNHEKQAVANSLDCDCDYASADDERFGCVAHQYAMRSLSAENRRWLRTWPDLATVQTKRGTILLCHGSPQRTNEFLFESQLDDVRLNRWLDEFQAVGLVCTHSGLPWVRLLANHRFAVNCGVVGKPDHDGDPAVHYAIVETSDGWAEKENLRIERVEYNHLHWADQLDRKGVERIFVAPLRTGIWTCGVASLPASEKRWNDTPSSMTGIGPISTRW